MPDDRDAFNQLVDSIQLAQALAMAAVHTVRELLVVVGRQQADPIRYINDLYDRVVDRFDQDDQVAATEAAAAGRAYVGAMFRDARETLLRPPG